MYPIAKITEPGFKCWRIVSPHVFTVRDHGRLAANRGPFARAVEEGDIDVGIRVEIVGLSAFRVGVEDQIDPTVFLEILISFFVSPPRLDGDALSTLSKYEYGRLDV